ncbi:MAG TPA: aspartate kinase [Longimicrobiales bacterium]|nr:aspartate kinase [Longimicrobiales bacterium]
MTQGGSAGAPRPRSGPVVYKFGGSSLADADRVRHVAGLVERMPLPPAVVVSATGSTTDRLLEVLANEPGARRSALTAIVQDHRELLRKLGAGPDLTAELDRRVAAAEEALDSLDAAAAVAQGADGVLALGEDLAALALVAALRERGVPARHVDARTVIRTDAAFGFANPAEAAIRDQVSTRLLPVLSGGEVGVVQGFVGATADGRTTTLGRGGSDLTATLLGAALDSVAVHIWTDVEGVLSADPRLVEHPRVLDVVGFEEAIELAYFGARVLHSGAAKQAVARGVPVRIRSTFAPERDGTLILPERWGGAGIAAVAAKHQVSLIKVRARRSALPYGFLARVFEVLARHRLAVDLVATSHTSTAFTVDESEEIHDVARELVEVAEVDVRTGLATVTVVGNGLLREPGFDARVFGAVGFTPIHLVSQASDVSLSLVVDGDDAEALVRRLHEELVGSSSRSAAPG